MFEKVSLDTPNSRPQAASTFASISRQTQTAAADHPTAWQRKQSALQSSDGQHGSEIPGDDATSQSFQNSGSEPSDRDDLAQNGDQGSKQRRSRHRPTISFSPEVTTDSGHRLSIEQPLSRSRQGSVQNGATNPTPQSNGVAIAVHSKPRTIPFDGRKDFESPESEADQLGNTSTWGLKSGHISMSVTQGSLLRGQIAAQNGLAVRRAREPTLEEKADIDAIASLTSAATASPIHEEAQTPIDPISNFLLSPTADSSPLDVSPNHWNARRTQSSGALTSSQRTRSLRSDRTGTSGGRRLTRRVSSKVGPQSASPASAFLSMWSKDDSGSAPAPEPDSEGQEIGDHSEYIIGRQIGFGGFSVVKEVFTIAREGEKITRAVKIVRKQVDGKTEHDNERVQRELEREVSIWRFLKHRHILPLIAVYDSPFATFCITRLNVGGTLFDLVRSNRRASPKPTLISAAHARSYSAQIAAALRYLHEDVRVAHRDIKLENCLLDRSGEGDAGRACGGLVQLCDFGMSDFYTNEHRQSPEPFEERGDASQSNGGSYGLSFDASRPGSSGGASSSASSITAGRLSIPPSSVSSTAVGSLAYAAPELLAKPDESVDRRQQEQIVYSPAVDMWAFGIVTYALIAGELPFQHTFEPKLAMSIAKGDWDPAPLERVLARWTEQGEADGRWAPESTKELVTACLEPDPDARWTIAEVVDSAWLANCQELIEADHETTWLE